MNLLMPHHKISAHLWVLVLSALLLLTQGVELHIHDVDHQPMQHHDDEQNMILDSDHHHTVIKHPSFDSSHADHHDFVMNEFDTVPVAIQQQASSILSPMDVMVTLLWLLIAGVSPSYRLWARQITPPPLERRYHLIPPLRAPPC